MLLSDSDTIALKMHKKELARARFHATEKIISIKNKRRDHSITS